MDSILEFVMDIGRLYPQALPFAMEVINCDKSKVLEGGTFRSGGWLEEDGVVIGSLTPYFKQKLNHDSITNKLGAALLRMVFFDEFAGESRRLSQRRQEVFNIKVRHLLPIEELPQGPYHKKSLPI